jgi:creatinine amidohydrolase/Fe(II)-dependent formamide hydrolase-like protein
MRNFDPRVIKVTIYAITLVCLLAVGVYHRLSEPSIPPSSISSDLVEANPLLPTSETYLESLTWMDVRDKIRDGYTRIIIPTGGIEQNGPFVALNKHDVIVKHLSAEVARALPRTLVAPVVSFVPEGAISPPSGHMQYPGTISVSERTFVTLLEEIGASLGMHGFREIIILGDSGQSQAGMREAAERLLRRPPAPGVRAIFVPEFYDYEDVRRYLRERGINEKPEQFHEELSFSLQLLAIAPKTINYDKRIAAGHTELGGLSLLDREALTQLGKDIIARRVAATVAAINRQLAGTPLPAH